MLVIPTVYDLYSCLHNETKISFYHWKFLYRSVLTNGIAFDQILNNQPSNGDFSVYS